MRAVVQRVREARVEVDGRVTGRIGLGLLVLVGIAITDTRREADYMADKVAGLRIFPDEAGRMNRDIGDSGGGLLIVSQFTLCGDTRRGRRPSFAGAAGPEQARALYEYFVESLRARGLPVETGTFQAFMSVHLINDGPVTIVLDSSPIT